MAQVELSNCPEKIYSPERRPGVSELEKHIAADAEPVSPAAAG
jgi:hypothetical protein